MINLYLMGGSGTGKTTLAKKLEKAAPEHFYRVRELSTREIRDGEVDGFDYKFITNEKFDELKKSFKLFEYVEKQFPPYKYGGEFSELSDEKINIIVASMEGFLSGLRETNERYGYENCNSILVNIINDDILDIEREGRDPKFEENFNLGVINELKDNSNWINYNNYWCDYCEVKLSELKKVRDDEKKLLDFFFEFIRDLWE